MSDEAPRTLGAYKLVESLGHGGMAKVFRARRDGPGGFVKDVALKQILPEYAQNAQLVHRFMEEARIAGALIHGNIVQVYDFGFVDGQYFIAMEYIDGLSLAAVLDACVESGIPLPSPLVAFIGAEVASGLAYAHSLTDEQGQHIEVVHRDVSPQNIMLSYAGDVKVGDFGIVKAADSLIRTEAGMRLGKLNYMSPEQALGSKLDSRTDMFALGVTLWEAITLRPLLPRGNPVTTIEYLAKGDFPLPSSFEKDTPPELEELVMQALSKDRDERYLDCEVMARGLRAYVHTFAPGFGRHDLVEYLEWLGADGNRPSGVGPPVPPPAPLQTLRGGRPGREGKRTRLLPWIALAAAPLLGISCGAATFAGFALLARDDSPEITTPETQQILTPPATSDHMNSISTPGGLPNQSPAGAAQQPGDVMPPVYQPQPGVVTPAPSPHSPLQPDPVPGQPSNQQSTGQPLPSPFAKAPSDGHRRQGGTRRSKQRDRPRQRLEAMNEQGNGREVKPDRDADGGTRRSSSQ